MHNLIINVKALENLDLAELKQGIKYNDPDAIFKAGMMLHQGIKTKANPAKSLEWLTKAAMLNHRDAAYNLGLIYLCGMGVPCNIKKGRDYIEMAVKNGAQAHALLKRIDEKYRPRNYRDRVFDPDLLNEHYNKQIASRYIPRGIDVGLILSLIVMAIGMYIFISGVLDVRGILLLGVGAIYLCWRPYKSKMPDNKMKANPQWGPDKTLASIDEQLQFADPVAIEGKALQNDSDAIYKLGYMYYKGIHKPQDYTEAAQWLQKGSMLRNRDAAYLLGIMYLKGEGVAANTRRGFDLVETAANQNHREAAGLTFRILDRYKRSELNQVHFFDHTLLEPVEDEYVIYKIFKNKIIIFLIILFIMLSLVSAFSENRLYTRIAVIVFCIISMFYIIKKILFKK